VELIGPYLAACTLLVVAGATKTVRPLDTARAVAAVLPVRLAVVAPLVRIAAATEGAIGIAGIVHPSPWTAWAVAVSYLLFAGFVTVVLTRGGPLASCGCFGTPDTPATRLHVVVDLVLAASAATVAAGVSAGWLPVVLDPQPWHGVPLLLASLVGAWVAALTLTRLAVLGASRRELGITRGVAR
jgi:hypothetical protein